MNKSRKINIKAVYLCLFYFLSLVPSFLFHEHSNHYVSFEKADACERKIYYAEKENSCQHKDHVTKELEKCQLCDHHTVSLHTQATVYSGSVRTISREEICLFEVRLSDFFVSESGNRGPPAI